MLGCLLHGVLDGKGNTTVILAIYQLGMAVFTTAVPWCDTLWLMLLMRILMGICCGGLDTGNCIIYEPVQEISNKLKF